MTTSVLHFPACDTLPDLHVTVVDATLQPPHPQTDAVQIHHHQQEAQSQKLESPNNRHGKKDSFFDQMSDDHEAYRHPGDKFSSLVEFAKHVEHMDSLALLQLVEPKIMEDFSSWDLLVRRSRRLTKSVDCP